MPTGVDCKLYVAPSEKDTSTAVATLQSDADFIETCVKDLTYELSASDVDASDRCGNGFRAMVPGLKDFSISFDIVKKKSSGVLPTYFTNLRNAYQNKTLISVLALDDDRSTTGADGYVAVGQVFDFSEDQNLDEVVKNRVTIKFSGETSYPPVPVTMP